MKVLRQNFTRKLELKSYKIQWCLLTQANHLKVLLNRKAINQRLIEYRSVLNNSLNHVDPKVHSSEVLAKAKLTLEIEIN